MRRMNLTRTMTVTQELRCGDADRRCLGGAILWQCKAGCPLEEIPWLGTDGDRQPRNGNGV